MLLQLGKQVVGELENWPETLFICKSGTDLVLAVSSFGFLNWLVQAVTEGYVQLKDHHKCCDIDPKARNYWYRKASKVWPKGVRRIPVLLKPIVQAVDVTTTAWDGTETLLIELQSLCGWEGGQGRTAHFFVLEYTDRPAPVLHITL